MSTAALELSDHSIEVFANNLEVYSEVCLKIRDKDAKLLPLRFNFAQRFVHEQLAKQYAAEGRVRAVILKARQTGFSTYTAARFYRRLTMMPHQRALVVAHEQKPAEVLFGMYDLFHSYLPDEMRPMVRGEKRTRELFYDNPSSKDRRNHPGLNSAITVDTANNVNIGRGATVQMVHASEMGQWLKPEEPWLSLMQSVPKRNSEVIIESTAKGVGNFFHQTWLDAIEGANDFLPIFLPWFIHEEYREPLTRDERDTLKSTLSDSEVQMTTEGVLYQGVVHKISLEQVNWRRWAIKNNCLGDERLFQQEYPSTPEEAFLVSGNTFIEEKVLKDYHDRCEPPKARGDLQSFSGGVIFRDSHSGYLRIWNRPGEFDRKTEKEPVYVIGADTASGRKVAKKEESLTNPERGGRDFSVADVVDVANHRQVAQLHGRMAPEVFATHVNYLGKWYSTANRVGTRTPALLAVEKNHNCVDEETEALTPEGWRRHSELAEGDLIRVQDPRTGLARWSSVERMYRADVLGEPMLEVDKQKHSSLTTLNHKWWVQRARRDGSREAVFTTSDEMRQHDRVLCAARSADSPVVATYEDAFVELVGWFWTEGSVNSKGNGSVRLAQSERHNPAYVNRIRVLLTNLYGPARVLKPGCQDKEAPGWSESRESHGMVRWYLNTPAGREFLAVAPGRVPSGAFISALTDNQLWRFLQSSLSAEASWSNKQNSVWIVQKHREPLEAIQMAATLWGWQTSLTRSGKNFCLTFHLEDAVLPNYGNSMEKVSYDGVIWCPKVATGVWLARRRGRVFYTGNSGESVLRILQQDLRYPNLFRSRRINRRFNRPEDRMGWVTTVETRMPMLDSLAQAMRAGTLGIPNRDTIRELMSFVRDDEGKPQAQEGAHDDRVIALAIANEIGRHAFLIPPRHYEEHTLGKDKSGTSPSGMFSY